MSLISHQVFLVSVAEIPDKADTCVSFPLAAWQGMLPAPDHHSHIPKWLGSSLLYSCVESEVRLRRRYTARCLECYFRTSETSRKSLSTSTYSWWQSWKYLLHLSVPLADDKIACEIHHCSQNIRETSFHPEEFKERSKQLTSPVEEQLKGGQGSDKMNCSKGTHREERQFLLILHIAKVAAAVACYWGVTHCSLLLDEDMVSQFFKCCLIFWFRGITWGNSLIRGHLWYRAAPLLYAFWFLLSRGVHYCVVRVLKKIIFTIWIDIVQSKKHWLFYHTKWSFHVVTIPYFCKNVIRGKVSWREE